MEQEHPKCPKIRKSTSLKAAAVALGVAGIVGLTISSAASLNLAGGIRRRRHERRRCVPARRIPITVSFDHHLLGDAPGYTVTGVKLGADRRRLRRPVRQGDPAGCIQRVARRGHRHGRHRQRSPPDVPGSIAATSVVGTAVVIYN